VKSFVIKDWGVPCSQNENNFTNGEEHESQSRLA
jgi:hypothetical protein